MEENSSLNCTLFLLLIISTILVLVDALEIANITNNWSNSFNLTSEIFNSCIKWELITKTCFALFFFVCCYKLFISYSYIVYGSRFY